jgi:hypothetical protein
MYAGWELRDPLGRRVGRVSRVFLAHPGRSVHVEVSLGPFGKRTVLLPVEGFRVDRDARVIYLGKDRRRPGGDEPGRTGTPRGGAAIPP